MKVISGELGAFSESLAEKPVIVVATKLDATTDRARLETLREFCGEHGLEFSRDFGGYRRRRARIGEIDCGCVG